MPGRDDVFGTALEVVDEVGSTSAVLRARAEAWCDGAGGAEAALMARKQLAGQGRLGRPWRSVEGNLHLSVLVRPGVLRWPGHWAILSGVALYEAVRGFVPAESRLGLKWPNDLLLGGAKLAGILVEAGLQEPPWLVIGFGVNLVVAPVDLGRPVACLRDLGLAPDAEVVARRLLHSFAGWRARYGREGFGPVRAAWLAAGHRPGELLWAGGVDGLFLGLAEDGGLMLDVDGVAQVVRAGEVT